MQRKSFLVVDDFQIVRDGLIAMLEDHFAAADIVGAVSCKEVVELCNNNSFDLIILDINLSDGLSINVLPAIKATNNKALMISATIDPEIIMETLRAGATGFISKFASRDEFIHAVNCSINNSRYICSCTIENIVSMDTNPYSKTLTDDPTLILTNKEVQIAKMITKGLTSKEIANNLGISFTTVNKHRNNILKKLEINSSKQLRFFFDNETNHSLPTNCH